MPIEYMGDANKVGFLYESGTYATSSGTTLQWIGMVTNHEISEAENVISARYLGTDTKNVDKFVNGARDIAGALTFHPQDWKFLAFALGQNLDAGSPTYTHTMTELENKSGNQFTADGPAASFTIEDSKAGQTVSGTNFIRTINGCMIGNMTLKGDLGGMIECSVDYVAKSSTFSSGASKLVTAATTRPFIWSDVRLDVPSGTQMTKLKTFEFGINLNLDPKHYMNGSRDIKYPIPQGRDYSLSATMDMDRTQAQTLYEQYYKGGSEFNTVLDIYAAATRNCPISMSGCRITEMPIPSPFEGVNEYEMTIVPQKCNAVATDLITTYNGW